MTMTRIACLLRMWGQSARYFHVEWGAGGSTTGRPEQERGARLVCLPLHAPGGVALGQAVHLINRHAVEVAGNRLLQCARGNGEAQSCLGGATRDQSVDEAGGK